MAVSSSHMNANPIQNREMVKILMMKMIAQNTSAMRREIQKIATFNPFGYLFGFLDSKIHY